MSFCARVCELDFGKVNLKLNLNFNKEVRATSTC